MKSGRHEKEASCQGSMFCFPSMEGSSYNAPTPRSFLLDGTGYNCKKTLYLMLNKDVHQCMTVFGSNMF